MESCVHPDCCFSLLHIDGVLVEGPGSWAIAEGELPRKELTEALYTRFITEDSDYSMISPI